MASILWKEGTSGQEEGSQYLSAFDIRMETFLLLGGQGTAFLKCKEVGLVNFNGSSCFCTSGWMLVKTWRLGSKRTPWNHSFQWLCDYIFIIKQSICVPHWLPGFLWFNPASFPSPVAMEFHAIPFHPIMFHSFHSIQSHFIPPLYTTVECLLCTKQCWVLWGRRWIGHGNKLQGTWNPLEVLAHMFETNGK